MHEIRQQRLADAFSDRLGGFIREALDDPEIIEVMVNACGRVWLDRLTDGRSETGQSRPPPRRSSAWSPITSARR